LGSEHFTTGFVKTYVQDNILDINPALLWPNFLYLPLAKNTTPWEEEVGEFVS
jgi:hypothetical protein